MSTDHFDPSVPSASVAAAHEAGYTHIYVACSGCSQIACKPFRLIRGLKRSATLKSIADRMKCAHCGCPPRPESVEYWRQNDHTPGLPGRAHRGE